MGLANLAVVKEHVTVKIAVFWGRFYTALIRCEFSGEEYHFINSLTILSSDARADGFPVYLGAVSRNVDLTKAKAQRPQLNLFLLAS